jgi:superfamily I DNA/RNA helicase
MPLFSGTAREADPMADLNPEQRSAVLHDGGPALVLAGPGTGKTLVLAGRVARLIRSGVPPRSILAVTFTNRAASEMKKRLIAMLPGEVSSQTVRVGTFHTFGLGIIRAHAEKTGRSAISSIIDEHDRRHILSRIAGGTFENINTLCEGISSMKRAPAEPNPPEDDALGSVLQQYERELRRLNALDFDDLITLPVVLFRQYPEILERCRAGLSHVLIDEYQDINGPQYQLVRLLVSEREGNLFAIGDPDQAIYGFRGADVGFINRFLDDYPQASVYSLKKSYRCSHIILRASRGVVEGERRRGAVLEGLSRGVRVNVTEHGSDRSEAEYVARSIERMMGGLRFFSMDSEIAEGGEEAVLNSLSEVAVLCRIREQMRTVEEAFGNHAIPYQAVGTDPFFREEPLISLVRLMKLARLGGREGMYASSHGAAGPAEGEMPEPFPDGIPVREGAERIIASHFEVERQRQRSPFRRFLDLCTGYGSDFHRFFQDLDLGSGPDVYDGELEQVTLMTLHAAKGLEFSCVFILGCEEGLIPCSLFHERNIDSSEERRLLYVGMTRAKKHLLLSHAKRRLLFGRIYHLKRSRFLDGIEEDLLSFGSAEAGKPRAPDSQLKLFG